MAIIQRKTMTGEAKDVATNAIKKETAKGNQTMIQLNQQRSVLNGLTQSQVLAANNQLDQVGKDIYQAQRQQRAQSASLGLMGQVANLRDTAAVAAMAQRELNTITNNIDQNAMAIAGQQDAINVAQVQAAQESIVEDYTQKLIDDGVAKRDRGREAYNAITGTLTGAAKGALGGWGASKGLQGILNPNTGIFKKAVSGLMLGGGLNMFADDLGKTIDIGNQNYGSGTTPYADSKYSSKGWATALGGTGALGLGIGVLDKRTRALDWSKQARIDFVDGSGFFGKRFAAGMEYGTSNVYENKWTISREKYMHNENILRQTPGRKPKGSGKSLFSRDKTGNMKTKGTVKVGTGSGAKLMNVQTLATKMNPWVIGISAAVGGLLGGLKGGLQKKYKLNKDDLYNMKGDTMQQFSDWGMELDQALIDAVYNK